MAILKSFSSDFVKDRIENNIIKYDFLPEVNITEVEPLFSDFFKKKSIIKKLQRGQEYIAKYKTNKGKEFECHFKYNPNAQFNYCTSERCVCDRTLVFLRELADKCVLKMLELRTYNKAILTDDMMKDFNKGKYDIYYEFGNIICFDEYHESLFATEDKKFLKSRFTTILPIKFDIKKN